MAKELKITLPVLDDIFTTQEERDEKQQEKIIQLPPSEISAFPEHPFKVLMDDAMKEMVESIKKYGVLSPVLVRPKEDGGFEMVAGHRRQHEAIQAELKKSLVLFAIYRTMRLS